MIIGRVANNECLPFLDGAFDCYISCLSLMLVDNHENMLREALRVTSKGAHFAFSVWGRKENVQNFSILEDVLIRHELIPQAPLTKYTCKDPEPTRQLMLQLGFTNIHIWYQHMNFNFEDEFKFCEAMCQTNMAREALHKAGSDSIRD